MALSDSELERYARHIILRELGGAGQKKLLAARVLVVGAGGLGSPAALYLAAAGVGTIGIVDDDTVALSNLQRQILFATADIGRPKVEAAKDRLHALNPGIRIETHKMRLTAENAEALIASYDLVADGCDNFATRFAVNDACYRLRIPLISAAVGRFDGQLATFRAYERPDLPCYRCFLPEEPPAGTVPDCAEGGIVGALTGVIGTLQAMEVIKELTGLGETLAGRLLLYDALATRIRTVKLPADPHCLLCSTEARAKAAPTPNRKLPPSRLRGR